MSDEPFGPRPPFKAMRHPAPDQTSWIVARRLPSGGWETVGEPMTEPEARVAAAKSNAAALAAG